MKNTQLTVPKQTEFLARKTALSDCRPRFVPSFKQSHRKSPMLL